MRSKYDFGKTKKKTPTTTKKKLTSNPPNK